MNNDAERYFWTKTTDEGMKLGLSKDAQDELGNVMYIDLPKVGSELVAGQTFVSMEAEKAVSDMPSPISGTVTGLNPALADGTDALNGDWDEAWLLTFTPAK